MKYFHKIWADIRKGENLDLYLTVLVAVLLSILNIIGSPQPAAMDSLSLVILALLTISMLGNRHRLEKILSGSQIGIDDILVKDFSDDIQKEITDQMENSRDLLIVGTDLYGTLQQRYHLLEKRLNNYKKVRILLVDPDGIACKILAKRRYRPITSEQYALQVRSSLEALTKLNKNTQGNLELRTIDYPINRGGIFVDTDTPDGRLFSWNHSYKSQDVARPKLDFVKSDGYWFEFYCNEVNALWKDSTEWKES